MKQMITNIVKTGILACLFIGLFSCNEDKGNYDYEEISAIEKIEISDTTVLVGSTLRITPKLTFDSLLSQQASEEDFDFVWHIQSDDKYPVLQEGRNLEIEIVAPNFLIAQNRILVYRATNKKTGVSYNKLFSVNPVSALTIGYVALCDKGDELEIDIVALNNRKFTLYTDVLATSGSELPRTGVKPWDIVSYADPFAMNPFAVEGDYSMFVLTDKYTTRILPMNYSWKESYDISNLIEKNSYLDTTFVKQGKKVIAQQLHYNYQSGRPHVAMYHQEPDGTCNWYLSTTYMMFSQFAVQMNRLRPSGEPRYEPAPYVTVLRSGIMYYDVNAKNFMYGSIQLSSLASKDLYYTEKIPVEVDNELFKFSDPNNGLLYMGIVPGDDINSRGYAILKESNGSFKYIEFTSSTTTASSLSDLTKTDSKLRVTKIAAGSQIADAKFFARMPQFSNLEYLYYVTNNNKVYCVSLSTGAYTDITSSILTDNEYSEITLFKFTLPESNWGETDIKRALAVGTYNASIGPKTGGKLEFFLPTAEKDGNLARTKYPAEKPFDDGYQIDMSWTGLGKIVGLTYKRR